MTDIEQIMRRPLCELCVMHDCPDEHYTQCIQSHIDKQQYVLGVDAETAVRNLQQFVLARR